MPWHSRPPALKPLRKTQQPETPTQPAAAQSGGYVGEDTCLTCHEDMQKGYRDSLHGQAAHPRVPRANQDCESCHGPGAKHIEDPSAPGFILRFDEVQAQEASEACLTCPNRDSHVCGTAACTINGTCRA